MVLPGVQQLRLVQKPLGLPLFQLGTEPVSRRPTIRVQEPPAVLEMCEVLQVRRVLSFVSQSHRARLLRKLRLLRQVPAMGPRRLRRSRPGRHQQSRPPRQVRVSSLQNQKCYYVLNLSYIYLYYIYIISTAKQY